MSAVRECQLKAAVRRPCGGAWVWSATRIWPVCRAALGSPTHRSLANAFLARIRGERSANLKKAFVGYETALGVLTRNAFPRDHLQTARLLAGASLLVGDWHKAGLAAQLPGTHSWFCTVKAWTRLELKV